MYGIDMVNKWDTLVVAEDEFMSAVREPSRPDLEAYNYAITAPFNFVVKDLIDVLGPRLVAYIGGVTELRAVREWTDSREPKDANVQPRIRLALQVARLIIGRDSPQVAQAWFQGLNPKLGDRSPARLLREGDIDEVGPEILTAARAFVIGG